MDIGVDGEGREGGFRKGGGMVVVGGMWYAAGSWRKPKSLDGMSSMPRGVPSWGDNARDGRAGDRTRVGRFDGVRVDGVDADRGLRLGVSAVSHTMCDVHHRASHTKLNILVCISVERAPRQLPGKRRNCFI